MNIPFLLCIPGILGNMEDPNEWDRAFAAEFDESVGRGVPFPYETGVIAGSGVFNPGGLERSADQVAEILRKAMALKYTRIKVACHSHGNPVLCTALERNADLAVDDIHLIAAAMSEDCDVNFLNSLAGNNAVKRVIAYTSANDDVLAGPGGVPGYGKFGLLGPQNVKQVGAILAPIEAYYGGHSGYFDRSNAARTYARILKG